MNTAKTWLVGIVIMSAVLIAEKASASTLCNFKEQTVVTNEEGQQVISKQRVDTCLDKTPPVEYGLARQCGVPRQIDPRIPTETISCQLDDGSWRQHNVFYAIDQFGKKTEITNFNEPDFTDYRSGRFAEVLMAKIAGWTSGLNSDQKHFYTLAIKNSLEQSSNGQGFQWHSGDARGTVTVVATFQTSQGHCKILHTSVQSGKRQVADAHRACYNNALNNWYWLADK